jgi:hypothetical protein
MSAGSFHGATTFVFVQKRGAVFRLTVKLRPGSVSPGPVAGNCEPGNGESSHGDKKFHPESKQISDAYMAKSVAETDITSGNQPSARVGARTFVTVAVSLTADSANLASD